MLWLDVVRTYTIQFQKSTKPLWGTIVRIGFTIINVDDLPSQSFENAALEQRRTIVFLQQDKVWAVEEM